MLHVRLHESPGQPTALMPANLWETRCSYACVLRVRDHAALVTRGLTSPDAMKHKNDKTRFLLFVPPVQCVHDVDRLLPLVDA